MPPMAYKVDTVVAPNRDFYNKGEFWSIPGNYQASIVPRSASMQFGAQIGNKMPSEDLMAFRKDTPFATDGLVTPTGELIQPIQYDRFMYANKKSRNRANGDLIRGDLPIAPINMGWFSTSAQPHLDLNQGAMNVMGGFDNTTNMKLAALMNASAGRALQTFGGANFSGDLGNGTQLGIYTKPGVDSTAVKHTSKTSPIVETLSNIPQMILNKQTNNSLYSGSIPQYKIQNKVDGTLQVTR